LQRIQRPRVLWAAYQIHARQTTRTSLHAVPSTSWTAAGPGAPSRRVFAPLVRRLVTALPGSRARECELLCAGGCRSDSPSGTHRLSLTRFWNDSSLGRPLAGHSTPPRLGHSRLALCAASVGAPSVPSPNRPWADRGHIHARFIRGWREKTNTTGAGRPGIIPRNHRPARKSWSSRRAQALAEGRIPASIALMFVGARHREPLLATRSRFTASLSTVFSIRDGRTLGFCTLGSLNPHRPLDTAACPQGFIKAIPDPEKPRSFPPAREFLFVRQSANSKPYKKKGAVRSR